MSQSGKLYIFNMEKFEDPKIAELTGNQLDVENFQKTFREYNANVDSVFKNLTLEQLRQEITTITRTDFSQFKYFVVVILTHGDNKEVLLSHNETFDLEREIINRILTNETLKQTPKLFVIDACKGPWNLLELESDGNASRPNFFPRQVLRCYSTSEGLQAFTTEERGSFFVEVFCEFLRNYGKNKSVQSIMNESIDAVHEKSGKRQLPSYYTNFTEKESENFVLGNLM